MLVSEIEKKPEVNSRATWAMTSQENGMSSITAGGARAGARYGRWRMTSRTNLLPMYASISATEPPSVR